MRWVIEDMQNPEWYWNEEDEEYDEEYDEDDDYEEYDGYDVYDDDGAWPDWHALMTLPSTHTFRYIDPFARAHVAVYTVCMSSRGLQGRRRDSLR